VREREPLSRLRRRRAQQVAEPDGRQDSGHADATQFREHGPPKTLLCRVYRQSAAHFAHGPKKLPDGEEKQQLTSVIRPTEKRSMPPYKHQEVWTKHIMSACCFTEDRHDLVKANRGSVG